MGPPSSHRIPRVRWYFGYSLLASCFAYRIITFFDAASQPLRLHFTIRCVSPNPEGIATPGLASSHFARRYFGNLVWFLFLRLLRCFSSAGIPSYGYVFTIRCYAMNHSGFPHSEISGSMRICRSPKLIAACHVLLRLLMPRHSPYALLSLNFQFSSSLLIKS